MVLLRASFSLAIVSAEPRVVHCGIHAFAATTMGVGIGPHSITFIATDGAAIGEPKTGLGHSTGMSTIPTITVKSGVGMTVGVGKTLVIDVLQIGDL